MTEQNPDQVGQFTRISYLLRKPELTADEANELTELITDMASKNVLERIDTIRTRLESKFDGNIAQLNSKFDGNIAQLNSKLDSQDSKFDGNIAQLNSKFDGNIAQLNSKLDSQDSKFDGNNARLESKIDSQNAKYNTMIVILSILAATGVLGFLANIFNWGG